MYNLSREKFEKIVWEGIESIPKRFLVKLNNVGIVVEDEPTAAQIKKLKIKKDWTLFGLYEGVPQSKRSAYYGAVLPDKITIFQKPIEEASRNEEDIRRIVRDTVWHEIAHHFGIDESRVQRAETLRNHVVKVHEKNT